MAKPQKLKISIKLDIPQPSEAKDIQYVRMPEPLPSHSCCSSQPSGHTGPYPSFLAAGGLGRHYFHHSRSGPGSSGRSVYHGSCTPSRCHYYGRCPKSICVGSKSRTASPQSSASGSSSGSAHHGSPGSDFGKQTRTKAFEIPLEEQRGSGKGSPDKKEPAEDSTPGSCMVLT
ncbi:hypothetical protein PG994_012909 [Apiospora phragmitis]|uniref:Uncharacterized protein n=1 Tax=Apiospora phragmitis TaxID=2905665 RepID=A0ABR1T8T9_9PEZI